MTVRTPVAVLGATGTVGQKFVRLLADHPWFDVVAVAASEQSAGKRYGDIVRWRESTPIPERIADMIVQRSAPPLPGRIVFSALDASVALEIEQAFAKAGVLVVSNTRTHRMESDVPLMIPEINASHLSLLPIQRARRNWPGAILTNPNCSTAALVMALAPLHAAFGVERVFVSTMQAISGAGYPGVASLDILGNVVPYIGGEEEKMETETLKILGTIAGETLTPAQITISAHTNRVAVIDGHLMTASIALGKRVTPEEATAALAAYTGDARVRGLPSSPARPVEVDARPDRPQPRLDLDRGNGMTVTVGRVRRCNLFDLRLVVLGHNTVRGAAGQAVQIAELLVNEGIA